MPLRVFINGMGRIGRLLVRKLFDAEGIEIVGINDEYMTESKLAYLLNHDTVYGDWYISGYKDVVQGHDNDGYITIDAMSIPFYTASRLVDIDLGYLRVDIVLECTGQFSDNPTEMLQQSWDAGARGCLFCYPLSTAYRHYVYNINASQKINLVDTPTSAGSASMNAAALLLKAINDGTGINTAFIEEVRSYTGDQNLCDNVTGDKFVERGRAAAQNIVPTTNTDIKLVAVLLPELNGKVLSNALRTPTIVGGTINATIVLPKTFTADEINVAIKAAASDSLTFSDERLVSSDVVSDDSIPIFLVAQTKVIGNVCNVTLLYDNEMGFVNQIVKLLQYGNIVLE